MPEISIIVPVYNSEKYLPRCLDSLLNSTFKNIEILLMNDGSTDNSLNICNAYQKKYPDIIKVFSHRNIGVSLTRNEGIKKARGKYIMFIDNDDYVGQDYLMNYYTAITSGNYDAVFGGYQRVNTKDEVLYKVILQDTEWSKYKIVSPWAKIYLRTFIQKNKITFLNSNIGEDIYFNTQVVNMTDKIKIIDDVNYKWFDNEESISNTLHKKASTKLQFKFLLDETYNVLQKKDYTNRLIVEYFFMKTIAWYLFYIAKETPYHKVISEKDKYLIWLKKHYPKYQKNKYLSPFRPEGESFKNRFAVYLLMKGTFLHIDNVILKIFK